jgi:hypothetical protein
MQEQFVAGQKIQIRQHEVLPGDPSQYVADPPVPPGPIDLWIYARVMEVMPDGKLRVIVGHAGNRQHGAELFVDPSDARGKADLEALRDAVKNPNPEQQQRLTKHFAVQAENLS